MLDNQANKYIKLFAEAMLVERCLAKNTIDAYKTDLKDFFVFILTKRKCTNIQKIESADISVYMTHLARNNIATSTSARKLSALKQFFQFLYADGEILQNPTNAVEPPKRVLSIPKPLSEENLKKLFKAAYEDISPKGIRMIAILEILYACGLRVSELVCMKKNAIQKKIFPDDKRVFHYIIVDGKGGKERITPISDSAVTAVKEYQKIRKKFLIGEKKSKWFFPSHGNSGHLTRQQLGLMIKKLASEAGINKEQISPHVLRHSFASHLLNKGMDLRILQELLGHTDISTTQIYTYIADERLKALVRKSHPLA